MVSQKKILLQYLPKFLGVYFNAMSYFNRDKVNVKVYNLFTYPRAAKISDQDRAFLESCEERKKLATSYGNMQTYQWNTNGDKSILLIHGWESNSARWKDFIPQLIQKNYHVISIDAPAHGASDGNNFHMIAYGDFLNAAHQYFEPDYAVGHSVGGGSLTYYLSHYDHPKPKKIALLGVPSEMTQMLDYYSNIIGLKKRTLLGLRQYIEKSTGKDIAYYSIKKFCERIDVPTLLVHDRQDEIVKEEDILSYNAILPESEIVITENLGHSLNGTLVYEKIQEYFS